MTVLLRTNRELPATYARWVALGREEPKLDPARRISTGKLLEAAFDQSALEWLNLARERLGNEPSAGLAHTPSCAANASDFGVMLAWSKLVESWAEEAEEILVICDDPWLFRHLASRPRVQAGQAPSLGLKELKLRLRGFAARTVAALRLFRYARACRNKQRIEPGGAWLLVYAHPKSGPDGTDAYFGDLLKEIPGVKRLIHVDGTPERAAGLGLSLHGFGRLAKILSLPFARWQPEKLSNDWLVRRAAALEGGTGQGALIAWQMECQREWLKVAKPKIAVWPWENHSWERDFVRACRAAGVKTLGYQHSVIGGRMLNYSPRSNLDGEMSLPDHIFCAGPATREQLLDWSMKAEKLSIAGALRFTVVKAPAYAPDAPIFLALPFDGQVARQMVEAARNVRERRFLVKDHPMTPFNFAEGENLHRTEKPLGEQEAVSAVVFAATTVGLEALIAGLPTFRFLPRGCIALDILPQDMNCLTVEAESLEAALSAAQPGAKIERERVFGQVDWSIWREALQ